MIRPKSIRAQRWRVADPVPVDLQRQQSHLHPVMLQVLYNRGLRTTGAIQAFLEGRYLEKDDPFLLPDMEPAVARVEQAIANGEKIFVYGDFDADGVTATVLLIEALRGLGLSREQAQPYIPDRVDEGYGLNEEALTALREKGAGLVISVDCGIRSVGEVAHARSLGLDMIVTDHHSLGPVMPEAVAVINPKRPDSQYPERMLAGVGIAFKLAQALHQALPRKTAFEESRLLDLVALGTVADLAPLQGENRLLVRAGLDQLNLCERPGVKALADVAGLRPGTITAEGIGFGLGPRINAAGRLAHAYDAARLLAASNEMTARRQAEELNRLNQERRLLTRELSAKAEEMMESTEDPILIAADSNFVAGVVGLVASRLAEKHYRPAIVMEQGEQESRGSCRSIPGFHITQALDEVSDLLVRHGGHSQAAGFTIQNKDLSAFRERLTAVAAERLQAVELQPELKVDAEIDLRDVDWALQGLLEQLEPTGQANATPMFVSRAVPVLNHRAVGQDGAHLQMVVGDSQYALRTIAFRQGEWAKCMPPRIDLVYTVGINEWRGQRNLQLVVQDIQATDSLL